NSTGSGCEAIDYSHENRRATLIFIFSGPSHSILCYFCKSRIIEYDHLESDLWIKHIVPQGLESRDSHDGARAVVVGEVWEVLKSCGYGVPIA
ncbi:hypothetical protein LY76DRAFT_463449, partial [Colletotrichum caudatum]